MQRIDAHVHFVPDAYRSELERRRLAPYPLPRWTRELMVAFMDRYAIDAAVVSLPPPGAALGDRAMRRELARLANDALAELVASDPSRFAGLAVLPLPDVHDALAELERALGPLALDGVALLSNVGGMYPGAAALAPVMEALNERAAYVFLHPAAPDGRHPLEAYPVWLSEFPFDTTRAIVDLIYSGALERWEDLRIQVAHLGGAAPFLAHRIASLAAREPQLSARAPAGALTYLGRLYYDTGLSANAPALAATAEVAGPGHVVFGSDWPYLDLPDGGDPAPALAALPAEERDRIDAINVAALVPRWAGAARMSRLGPLGAQDASSAVE